MADAICDEILTKSGFRCIGALDYRIRLSVWWHNEHRIELIVLPVGSVSLLKAQKAYYLRSITEQGETWARDIGPLQDYLESHMPEFRLSFAYFRDVPSHLAEAQARRKLTADAPTTPIPTIEEIARIQTRIDRQRHQDQSVQTLMGMDSGSSDLLTRYLRGQVESGRREVDRAEEELGRKKERLSLLRSLQSEYERKGSAASVVFSISSNLQVSASPAEFEDAVQHVVKEIRDLDRYQVSQKLQGGRLNIHVEEAREPVLVWIEQWLGGALSPKQLDRLSAPFKVLREAAAEHAMVTADE